MPSLPTRHLPDNVLDWWLDQQREFNRAWEIQRDLLPKEMPRLPGYQISGSCHPAQTVGGDYFDVLKFPPRHIAVCVADAAGKGISAALLMANLQAGIRSFASGSMAPGELCQKVNRLIFHNTTPGKFITLFYGLLDIDTRTLVYANAGHEPPILLHRDGSVRRLEEGGMVLGLLEDSRYEQGKVDLASGDWLLLFTDGVNDARSADDEPFGENRLLAQVAANREAGAADLRHKIVEAVVEFSGGQLQDDLALVLLHLE